MELLKADFDLGVEWKKLQRSQCLTRKDFWLLMCDLEAHMSFVFLLTATVFSESLFLGLSSILSCLFFLCMHNLPFEWVWAVQVCAMGCFPRFSTFVSLSLANGISCHLLTFRKPTVRISIKVNPGLCGTSLTAMFDWHFVFPVWRNMLVIQILLGSTAFLLYSPNFFVLFLCELVLLFFIQMACVRLSY